MTVWELQRNLRDEGSLYKELAWAHNQMALFFLREEDYQVGDLKLFSLKEIRDQAMAALREELELHVKATGTSSEEVRACLDLMSHWL